MFSGKNNLIYFPVHCSVYDETICICISHFSLPDNGLSSKNDLYMVSVAKGKMFQACS